MWAIFLDQDLVPLSFPKTYESSCIRWSLESILAGRFFFSIVQHLAVTLLQWVNPVSKHYYQKKEQPCLVETRSAAEVRPSTRNLTDSSCKHSFQRHLFQISASHGFYLLLIKTGPTHLSSFDPSVSVKAQRGKKKRHLWLACRGAFCFKLAVMRDWFQEEQVLIAFFERQRAKQINMLEKLKVMGCKLHFHLSGNAKVKRLILDERKKKKQNKLRAVLKLGIWCKYLIRSIFFFCPILWTSQPFWGKGGLSYFPWISVERLQRRQGLQTLVSKQGVKGQMGWQAVAENDPHTNPPHSAS